MSDKPKPKDMPWLQEAADAAMAKCPDGFGFIFLACPFGEGNRPLYYISNMKREDAVVTIETWLKQAGPPGKWMTHAE